MAELRVCVYLLVLLVVFQRTFASPLFGSSLFCSLFCDYGDDDDSSGGSIVDDLLSLFGDSSEESSTPRTSTTTPAAGVAKPQEISLLIPPASGMNLTFQSLGSSLLLSLFPWAGGGSATTAAPTTAATTPAGNGTAANATAA